MAKPNFPAPPNIDDLRAVLRRLHKNMDTDAALDSLLSGFSSARSVPEMETYQLEKVFPKRTAELIHSIPGIARAMLRDEYPEHPIISCMEDAGEFMRGLFLGKRFEQCYMLLLRKNRYLIREQLIQSGTVDSMPFYPRNILQTALAGEADAIVIAHNHPGGTPSPSSEDLNSTMALISALSPLQIPLLDHLIFARDKVVSIRATGLLEDSIWLDQPNRCPKYLATWLQPAPNAARRSSRRK